MSENPLEGSWSLVATACNNIIQWVATVLRGVEGSRAAAGGVVHDCSCCNGQGHMGKKFSSIKGTQSAEIDRKHYSASVSQEPRGDTKARVGAS